MGALRLAWRLQRWELASLAAFVVAVVVALVVIGWRMEHIQASAPACFGPAYGPAGSDQGSCEASFRAYSALQQIGPYAAVAATLAPFLLGVILGPPLVGREIEGRTAPIAWALSRSRARWLALRGIPITGFALAALLAVGLSGQTLARQLAGGEPGFDAVITSAPLLLARGALALTVGLAAGAIIGRAFPAVLATAFVLVLIHVGLTAGVDAWMAAEAQPVEQSSGMASGSKIYDSGLRDDETGEVFTFAQYYANNTVDETAEMPPPGMTMMAWQIPASEYPTWMAREAVMVSGLALIAGVTFVASALRRSPQ